jgi:hypothetical protein
VKKALVISLASAASLLLAAHPAAATDIGVPGDQPTIQDAIDAAASGDTISVAPGIYAQTLDFSGKDIHLRSTGGGAVTTLEPTAPGGPNTTTIRIVSGEGPGAIVEGFTFTNAGPVISVSGASPTIRDNAFDQIWLVGVDVADGSPQITRNVFSLGQSDALAVQLVNSNSEVSFNSVSDHPRGGVFVSGVSSPHIHHNTIKDSGNYNGWAPAIWLYTDSTSTVGIDHNLLLRNHGPAIELGASNWQTPQYATITDNEFIENDYGAAASVLNFGVNPGTATFERNYCVRTRGALPGYASEAIRADAGGLITRNNVYAHFHDTNDALWNYGIYSQGRSFWLENTTFVDMEIAVTRNRSDSSSCIDSIVWDWVFQVLGGDWMGPPFDYSDIGPTIGNARGPYNFTADPMFVNQAAGDYHLLAGSPCIDAPSGDPSTIVDLDGNPRDSLPDLGAYEYIGHDHWFRGDREKAGAMTVVFQGEPGETVLLGHSPNVRPTPVPTPYGDLWVGSPMTRLSLGTIGANGILEVTFNAPPYDVPTRFYTQALIGSTITPLQEVTLGG